jgi:hypothetical protein
MEANLCIFFNRSFMYVMPLEFQLSRARTEVLFTGIKNFHRLMSLGVFLCSMGYGGR